MKRWLFLLPLLGACDASGPTPYVPVYDPSSTEPVAMVEFCTLQAKNACAALRPCCGDAHLSFDEATCRANARGLCEARKQRALEVGLLYDDVQAGRCARGQSVLLRRCTTDAVTHDPVAADVAEACTQVFHGLAHEGESCNAKATRPCAPPALGSRIACESGVCRVRRPADVGELCGGVGCRAGLGCSGSPARCYPLLLPLGASCAGFTSVCDASDDAYCDPATFRCTRYPGPGEACSTTSVCARPYRCDTDKSGQKRCVDGKAIGVSCGESRECASRVCNETVRACLPSPFGYPLSGSSGSDGLAYVATMAATCDGLLGAGGGGLSVVPLPAPAP